MHFMNPPPIMKLVEIVRGADTSDETFNATKALALRSLIAKKEKKKKLLLFKLPLIRVGLD
jgi:3-hydroxyacyl-CoA dehydrogenase